MSKGNRRLQMDGHRGVFDPPTRSRVEQVLSAEALGVREAQYQDELLPRHPPGPQQSLYCLFRDKEGSTRDRGRSFWFKFRRRHLMLRAFFQF